MTADSTWKDIEARLDVTIAGLADGGAAGHAVDQEPLEVDDQVVVEDLREQLLAAGLPVAEAEASGAERCLLRSPVRTPGRAGAAVSTTMSP